MDERIRNGVGRAFALECKLRELWTEEGPQPLLRVRVEQQALKPAQLVLMRFALDYYDGTGGNLGFAEGLRALENGEGADALFFLAEFLGSAMTSLPESLEAWVAQYNEDFAASSTH